MKQFDAEAVRQRLENDAQFRFYIDALIADRMELEDENYELRSLITDWHFAEEMYRVVGERKDSINDPKRTYYAAKRRLIEAVSDGPQD